MLPVEQPFKTYTGLDGKPLDNGYVYFGQPNQNPQTAPVTVFWDAAGTIPAAQPLRTMNGYVLRAGAPANVFFDGAYSEMVLDSKKRQVFYARTSDEFSIASAVSKLSGISGASKIGFIQSGTGATPRTAQDELRETVKVTQFGVLGDGAHDDTAAINACFAYAAANKLTATLPATAGGYKTTDTVTLPAGGNLDMTGAFIKYAGPQDRPAMVLGTPGATNLHPLYCGLRVVQSGAYTWPSINHIGVRCVNAIRGSIDICHIEGFTVGWECYSDAPGYAYTRHTVGDLQDNKYAMVLRSVAVGAIVNFVNENIFIGGRYGTTSTTNGTGSRYGVLLTWDKVSSYRGHNANRWIGPCFELGVPTAGEAIPMWHDGVGGYNRVIEARYESGNSVFARIDNGPGAVINAVNNEYSVIYSASTSGAFVTGIQELNGANGNRYLPQDLYSRPAVSWNSGRLVDRISAYGATRAYVRGPLFLVSNGSPAPARFLNTATFLKCFKDELYLVSGFGIGVILDTSKIKRFGFLAQARAGREGRIAIKCFDANGAVLDNTGPAAPYVSGGISALSTTGNFGGAYSLASDNLYNKTPFTFGPNVQKAFVIFSGGTNAALLRSLTILGFMDTQDATGASAYGTLNIFSAPGSDFDAVALNKPDTNGVHGVYQRGQLIGNAVAAVGVPSHWAAITNDIGYLNFAWVASTAYADTGEICINGSNAYVCTVAGVSAAATGPTGTGTGIVDGTVTWDYLGPKAAFGTAANLV